MRSPLRITPLFFATFVAAAGAVCAAEACVSGGLSPDGKLEVAVVALKDPATPEITYDFVLRDFATKKVLTKIAAPSYAGTLEAAAGPMNEELGTMNSSVLWDGSNRAFAFNVRDTKRSRSTSVFASKNGLWSEVTLKDPSPAIFKDLGITEVDRCSYLDPVRWESGDVIVLQASGDCASPLPGTWFEYEVRYRLSDPGHCDIKRVSLKDRRG